MSRLLVFCVHNIRFLSHKDTAILGILQKINAQGYPEHYKCYFRVHDLC